MEFEWGQVRQGHLNNSRDRTAPFPGVISPGAAFAITKKFYFSSGGIDENYHGWGGEDVEFAIRVWLCGRGTGRGRVVVVPCSVVHHLYKGGHSYSIDNRGVIRNLT